MTKLTYSTLSRRERQIMDILYRLGRATANEVMAELSVDRHYSTVRTQLRVLEGKGHVRHEEIGLRYVYMPTAPRNTVRQSAVRHLVETFFDGSTEKMLTTLLGSEGTKLSGEELDRLGQLIEKAKKGAKR